MTINVCPAVPPSRNISMAQCKTVVTPLLTHLSYCCLALSHRYGPNLASVRASGHYFSAVSCLSLCLSWPDQAEHWYSLRYDWTPGNSLDFVVAWVYLLWYRVADDQFAVINRIQALPGTELLPYEVLVALVASVITWQPNWYTEVYKCLIRIESLLRRHRTSRWRLSHFPFEAPYLTEDPQ